MARLNVAAAGNAEENINLINARFQAEALRRLRGKDCGVLDNSFYSSAHTNGLQRDANSSFMWPLTANTLTDGITVGRGMATAYGYDIQSESEVNFTNLTAPSAGTKYFFIYLEWDLSNPVEANGKIDIHDNGAGATWTPPYQDNLITNPLGKYQMPLYRIAVNTAGSVTGRQNWEALKVDTIKDVLRAENANRAERADYADYAYGDTRKIKERLDSLNTRLAQLGFKQASIVVHSGSHSVSDASTIKVAYADYIDAGNSEVYQLGKVVYGRITLKLPQHIKSATNSSGFIITVASISGVSLPSANIELASVSAKTEQMNYKVTYTLTPLGDIVVKTVNGSGWHEVAKKTVPAILVLDFYQDKQFV